MCQRFYFLYLKMMGFNNVLFSCGVLFIFSCNSSSSKENNEETFKSAVEYNDYIINYQSKIINHILAVGGMMEKNLDSAEAMLLEGVLITDSALADVKAMPALNGDTLFRNKAVANFKFYRKLFTTDYRKIISINKKDEGATSKDFEMLQSIQMALKKEEAKLDKGLSNAQADFAKKNKMPLLDNEVQKKLDTTR